MMLKVCSKEIKNCQFCNKKFYPKAKMSKYCSLSCSVDKRRVKVDVDFNSTITCKKCHLELDSSNFWRTGKGFSSKCNSCTIREKEWGLKWKKAVYFIMAIKAKGYIANEIDIFRMIDLYDELMPNEKIPNKLNELTYSVIFNQIELWVLNFKNLTK